MRIFEFEDYRKYLSAHLGSLPSHGHGELSRIAEALGVASSFLSQVLHGHKNLSKEQAFLLASHLGLNSIETRYLGELVDLERAGKPQFRAFIKEQLEKLRIEARAQAGIPPADQPLDEVNQATFYSEWEYSAVQLATGIEGTHAPEKIAERLGMNEAKVHRILDFLVTVGLCTYCEGRYEVGKRRTHLRDESPLRPRHHMNWRLQAIERMPKREKDEIFFTGPMRIDEKTFSEIVAILKAVREKVNGLVDEAGDQALACLNIDWFRF